MAGAAQVPVLSRCHANILASAHQGQRPGSETRLRKTSPPVSASENATCEQHLCDPVVFVNSSQKRQRRVTAEKRLQTAPREMQAADQSEYHK